MSCAEMGTSWSAALVVGVTRFSASLQAASLEGHAHSAWVLMAVKGTYMALMQAEAGRSEAQGWLLIAMNSGARSCGRWLCPAHLIIKALGLQYDRCTSTDLLPRINDWSETI